MPIAKQVTIQLDEETYSMYRRCAEEDSQSLEDYIESALKRHIRTEYVDKQEMDDLLYDEDLLGRIRKRHEKAIAGLGNIVE